MRLTDILDPNRTQRLFHFLPFSVVLMRFFKGGGEDHERPVPRANRVQIPQKDENRPKLTHFWPPGDPQSVMWFFKTTLKYPQRFKELLKLKENAFQMHKTLFFWRFLQKSPFFLYFLYSYIGKYPKNKKVVHSGWAPNFKALKISIMHFVIV